MMLKRILLLSLLSISILLPSSSFAESIGLNTAKTVGMVQLKAQEEFWTDKPQLAPEAFPEREEYSISEVRLLKDSEERILAYILDLSPEGYIAVSPDTDIRPVIAYSFKGGFSLEEAPDNVLLHLLTWDMENRIEALTLTSEEIKEENNILWDKYLTPEGFFIQELSPDAQWGPLLTTTWEQSGPYNKFCPEDPDTFRCVVGCVATAMAQIVNYHKHPSSVTFSDSDDYTTTTRGIKIDDDHVARDFPSFTTLNSYLLNLQYGGDEDEVAALNFACGISVEMDYTSGGSGAYTSAVAAALKDKFKYYTAEYKSGTAADFYTVLESNMKNSKPAELSICQSCFFGHAIVADGFKNTGEYHLNFGWGGSSPDPITEAWYFLPAEMPAGYDTVKGGVVNITASRWSPGAAGGGGSKACFIATAAYGSYTNQHEISQNSRMRNDTRNYTNDPITVLQRFRDEHLLTNLSGRALVTCYERISPPIARYIEDKEPLKAIVRFYLKPMVWVAEKVTSNPSVTEKN